MIEQYDSSSMLDQSFYQYFQPFLFTLWSSHKQSIGISCINFQVHGDHIEEFEHFFGVINILFLHFLPSSFFLNEYIDSDLLFSTFFPSSVQKLFFPFDLYILYFYYFYVSNDFSVFATYFMSLHYLSYNLKFICLIY